MAEQGKRTPPPGWGVAGGAGATQAVLPRGVRMGVLEKGMHQLPSGVLLAVAEPLKPEAPLRVRLGTAEVAPTSSPWNTN